METDPINTDDTVTAFDKYHHYRLAVQSPDVDVEFFRERYRHLNAGIEPNTLREDFCSTFAICCEWVKLHENFHAIGIDLADEPITYGKRHHLSNLSPSQQQRIRLIQSDVVRVNTQADLICTTNFSHFYFKERQALKSYFTNCLASLQSGGILILDSFGGSQCYEANEEETVHDDFSYFWEQENYDPVTAHATFHIHFQRKGEKKRKRVFTYDWRLWSIPEVRELLIETGFRKSYVYWEGTDEDGEGNGEFAEVEHGEECESWICYIIGQK